LFSSLAFFISIYDELFACQVAFSSARFSESSEVDLKKYRFSGLSHKCSMKISRRLQAFEPSLPHEFFVWYFGYFKINSSLLSGAPIADRRQQGSQTRHNPSKIVFALFFGKLNLCTCQNHHLAQSRLFFVQMESFIGWLKPVWDSLFNTSAAARLYR